MRGDVMQGDGMLARLRPGDAAWLTALTALAGDSARVALVGGAVRDALLGVTPLDLDIVIEGADVQRLAEATGLPCVFHPAFQNATLELPDGRFADLVRARSELYPVPGQNPVPQAGTLEDDLKRRDFTLNALAFDLRSRALVDVVDGLDDLNRGVLRPLHARSLHDDASRLLRGARMAARLNLEATPELLGQVPEALRIAERTPRLWAEMKLALAEPRPWQVFSTLREWGAGTLLPNLEVMAVLDHVQQEGKTVTPNTYAAAFLAGSGEPDTLAEKLGLGDKPLDLLSRARSETYFAPGTPERQLRRILNPESYVPLTGKDVLTLGIPAGKQVGAALAHLAELRRTGQVRSPEDERAALREYLGNR